MQKHRISRRKFMAALTTGAGTILLGRHVLGSTGVTSPQAADPFRIVTLGKTGIKSTLLGMGTGFTGGNRSSNITRAGVAESLIKTAYEKGIRFFDCADSYGTHSPTRDALKTYPRESYVVGTKMWVLRGGIPEPERPDADIVVDRFRKELNTDYIDIVQLHCMMTGTWTDEQKRQMEILDNLKAKGIVKAHGVSVHSFQALEAAADSPWVDVIHVRINPFGISMDSKDPSQVTPVIEKMHKSGKGIIGMKLIGNGNYRDDSARIDEALKFVLGLGTVDMVIVGFEQPDQIDNYVGRFRKVTLA